LELAHRGHIIGPWTLDDDKWHTAVTRGQCLHSARQMGLVLTLQGALHCVFVIVPVCIFLFAIYSSHECFGLSESNMDIVRFNVLALLKFVVYLQL